MHKLGAAEYARRVRGGLRGADTVVAPTRAMLRELERLYGPLPQTAVVPLEKMLPPIPGTRIHVGLLVAFAAILVVHFVLTRTSWGLRLQIMGANPRAARHFGIDLKRLIVVSFLGSGCLVGLAACADIMGLWGYIRTGWDPAYGDTIIPFIAFFSVLSTGGDLAAQQANLPTDFIYVLVGLILLFMTVIEYLGRQRSLGTSYLPPGLRQALRGPRGFFRKKAAA
jgi:simple sugar transport system permease protein